MANKPQFRSNLTRVKRTPSLDTEPDSLKPIDKEEQHLNQITLYCYQPDQALKERDLMTIMGEDFHPQPGRFGTW